MQLSENMRLAWDSLRANRLRTALTLLGIIIGVGAVIAVMAIGRGARQAVLNEFAGFSANMVQLQATGGDGESRYVRFSEDDLRYLQRHLPEIEEIVPAYAFGAETRVNTETRKAFIEGAYAQYLQFTQAEMGEGRFISEEEHQSQAKVIVIGAAIAEERFGQRSPINQTIYVDGNPFRVIGVFAKETGLLGQMLGNDIDRAYVIPQSTALRLTGERTFGAILLDVKPGSDTANAGEAARELLQHRHPGAGYEVLTIKQLNEQISAVTGILTGVIGAIAGISLLVGGVGIMNIMLVSVSERTKEIGLRKAIGAKTTDIRNQFLIEAITICLGGGLIGTLLAAIPALAIGKLLQLPILIGLDSIGLAVAFSLVVGVAFGVYPARQAARKDPIEALRFE